MRVVLLLLSLFILITANAQNNIRGRVVDSTNTALPYISVALLNAKDSLLVKGSVSNDKGEYSFEKFRAGNYLVKALMIGAKETFSSAFFADSLTGFELPDMMLRSKGTVLKEVAITDIKQTIEFKDGMVVMNVEDNPVNAGNTVLELLKKIPGVTVDNQDNISLDGKAGVRIVLDGRVQQFSGQQLAVILSSMSSENISKIEVMKNPPAKYDAAGTAGMINIVSKKVKVSGLTGSISASGIKGHRYNGSVDGSINYQKNKITLFSNFGYTDHLYYRTYHWDKMAHSDSGTTHLVQDGAQSWFRDVFYYKAGLNYRLNKKITLGMAVNGGPASTPGTDKGVNTISGYNDLGFEHADFYNDAKDNWSNPNYNVNAEYIADTVGTVFNFSADYSDYNGTRNAKSDNTFSDVNNNPTLPPTVFKSDHITDIIIATQKLDFTTKLRRSYVLETGVKNTIVNSHNTYSYETQDPVTGQFTMDTVISNDNIYVENVFAGYLNIKKQLKHSSFQLGCRAENTAVDTENKTSGFSLSKTYLDFFPNASFDYSRSEKSSWQFNISRRIDRPNYKDLNPFKTYVDNYTIMIGNAYLLPQSSYNLSLSHTYKKTLTNSLTLTRYSNYMLAYDFQDDTSHATINYIKNISESNYYAYNLFFQKKIAKWWNATVSGSVYYSAIEGILEGTEYKKDILSYNANLNNDIILPRKFKIIVRGAFYGPSYSGTQETEAIWDLNIGGRKTMMKDKLAINIYVSDIFYTNVSRTVSKFQYQDYYYTSSPDSRRLRLTIQYKFGSMNIQKREALSNDDEKNRLEKK